MKVRDLKVKDKDWSRHPAHESLQITPWISDHEWMSVAESLLSLKSAHWSWALRVIQRWSKAVERLPMGVEMTLYVSEAAQSVLTLSMGGALNRVLNVLSQWADRRLGLTHYHDMARVLGLPVWIVDLRHETTHGQMPNPSQLLQGLQCTMKWTLRNYWRPEYDHLSQVIEKKDDIRHSREYQKLHKLLDCYGYLRLYVLWGTTNLGQLRDQTELYEHVTELWEHFQFHKLGPKRQRAALSIDEIGVKDAVMRIEDELVEVLSSADEFNRDFVADALVTSLIEDELLFPSNEMMETLKEHEDEDELRVLPKNLEMQWWDVLKLLTQYDHITLLVERLLVHGCSKDISPKHAILAQAWIRLICSESSTDAPSAKNSEKSSKKRKKQKKLPTPTQVTTTQFTLLDKEDVQSNPKFNEIVDNCLLEPTPFILGVMKCLLRLQTPRLSTLTENKVIQLMKIHLGQSLSNTNVPVDYEIQDLTSLLPSDNSLGDACSTGSSDSKSGNRVWKKAGSKVNWASIPLGLIPGQKLSVLTQEIISDRPSKNEPDTSSINLGADDDHVSEVRTLDWNQILQRSQTVSTSSNNLSTDSQDQIEESDENVPAFNRNPKRKVPLK
ncbi:hypothetical protein TCAL_14657 [Tigriopus californicus]|uniref:Ribosomal biogenesis protein LAS1L n=1 Tax=Tigriopus californicus TaxID=6832 RepID=A0A553P6W5_TIGCA|nr:hypothetical protein TCAL_14657 [Tigriopus californicus]